jgi:4-hydroxy-tetrahydrodipicolinate synthase
VDACLLMTPPYVKPTQEGLFQHFEMIANRVAIPQILYNVPSRTACDLLPETIERLAHCPNIVGVKEATGKIERTQDILQRCGGRLDVFSGDDPTALDLMKVGAKGVISVTANVVPRLMSDMAAAFLQGDQPSADALDQRLQPLHRALFIESNPIPTKWVLQHMGLIASGTLRLPLTPLTQASQAQLLLVNGVY